MPTSILGQIWNLADLNKDGKLDKKEFSIACYLIKKVLTNGQIVLPSLLPANLLIEPISIQPATIPLFPATFPTSTPNNFSTSLFTTSPPQLVPNIRMPSVPTSSTSTNNLMFQQSATITSQKINPTLLAGAIATPIATVNL